MFSALSWNVHRRPRFAVERAIANIADDADDLARSFRGQLGHHAFADPDFVIQRVALRPEPARHRLIDHHNRRGAGHVAVSDTTHIVLTTVPPCGLEATVQILYLALAQLFAQ